MITYEYFKQKILEDISKIYKKNFVVDHQEWTEVLKQIQDDLLYNQFYFQKDVSYQQFLERVFIYLSIHERYRRK